MIESLPPLEPSAGLLRSVPRLFGEPANLATGTVAAARMQSVGPGGGVQNNVTELTLDAQGRTVAVATTVNPMVAFHSVSRWNTAMGNSASRWLQGLNSGLNTTDLAIDGPFSAQYNVVSLCCYASITTNNNGLVVSMRVYHGGFWADPSPLPTVTLFGTGNVFHCDTSHVAPYVTNDMLAIRMNSPSSFSSNSFLCTYGVVPN